MSHPQMRRAAREILLIGVTAQIFLANFEAEQKRGWTSIKKGSYRMRMIKQRIASVARKSEGRISWTWRDVPNHLVLSEAEKVIAMREIKRELS